MLKTKGVEDTIIMPMEADLKRLETITNRFSKIGSLPIKKRSDIVRASRDVFDYLAGKASKGIAFTFYSSTNEIHLKINKELYCWVIENLLNNATDAVVGEGKIELSLLEEKDRVLINVIDTGKGIPKRLVKRIFQPGFTTKKRGWGLGLSLCRRIIEDYHQGSIQVRTSSKDKGTHFEIVLHK
jgi:signal transduction histidine kinase